MKLELTSHRFTQFLNDFLVISFILLITLAGRWLYDIDIWSLDYNKRFDVACTAKGGFVYRSENDIKCVKGKILNLNIGY